MMFLLLISCLMLTKVLSHMSLAFPYPRTTRDGADFPVWARNEPMYPGQNFPAALCSGLEEEDSVQSGNIFTVGQTLTIELYGTASHLGGHCAFWYSLDESTWYKIVDVKDCTILSSFTVTIPDTIPSDCSDRCVFAWSWTPRESAACEIYMTCADIRVEDAYASIGADDNPVTVNFQTLIDTNNCVRVDTDTHFTPIFGDLILDDGSTPSPVVVTTLGAGETSSPTTEKPTQANDCYLNPDDAINRNAEISNLGQCGEVGDMTYRCDDGSCCSQYGWCGPDDPTDSVQVALYCDNNQGDWRKTSCGSTTTTEDPSPAPVETATTDDPDNTSSGESYYVYVNGNNYWYIGVYIYGDGCQVGDVLDDTTFSNVYMQCEECTSTTWQELSTDGSGLWQLNSAFQLNYDTEISIMMVDSDGLVTEGLYIIGENAAAECTSLEAGETTNSKSSNNNNSSSNNNSNGLYLVLFIISMVILVLIITLLIAFYCWRKNQQNKQINYSNNYQHKQPLINEGNNGHTSETPFTQMN